MTNLSVNTGVVEYTINDNAKIVLNPADPVFVGRLFARFSEMEADDKAWREKIQGEKDPKSLLALYEEGDARFRAAINETLGAGVAEAVLGPASALALADGLPVWMNILLAVIDEMDSAIAKEQKANNPKLQKYLAKYRK